VERDGRYLIEMTNGTETIRFGCQREKGGLITELSLNGTNIITEHGNASMSGSIFWTSPQSDWVWPPPEAIDPGEHTAEVDEASGAVTLKSAVESILNVQIVKRFSPDLERMAVNLQYTIRNTGDAPRRFAPWEITRVATGGLTFFPTGQSQYDTDKGELPTTDEAGVTWFDYGASDITDGTEYKLYADGARGWLAHAAGGLLFVKSFHDEPPANRAPNQGEIEIYVKGGDYEEVENQGAYQEIPAGGELTWKLKWYIRNIPAGAEAVVGNQSIIDFIDELTS
jgi:hypothetical protein